MIIKFLYDSLLIFCDIRTVEQSDRLTPLEQRNDRCRRRQSEDMLYSRDFAKDS